MSTRVYGCHNRKPIVTVCAPTCQYTFTTLGQKDRGCIGCKERFTGLTGEAEPMTKLEIPNRPYVYALADPDGVIFYIGKGRNKRLYQHEMCAKRGKPGEKHERIRSILESGGKVQYHILSIHKTDAEACLAEIEAIAEHKNLTNKTKGGEPGASSAMSRAIAMRRAKQLLSKLLPFDRWVAGMSDERKQYLINISAGESLQEQWDWVESRLRREAADPMPHWVTTGTNGKAQFGYGRAPDSITLGNLKFVYTGSAPSFLRQSAEASNGQG